MGTRLTAPKTIDEYIANFPTNVQMLLKQIRQTVRQAAPDAEETIKYQMPTFTLHGNLVYFAAFKKHIGFYPPVATKSAKFKKEIATYEGPKGSLIFPFDQPLPLDLISRIVQLRVKENLAKVAAKRKRSLPKATHSSARKKAQ